VFLSDHSTRGVFSARKVAIYIASLSDGSACRKLSVSIPSQDRPHTHSMQELCLPVINNGRHHVIDVMLRIQVGDVEDVEDAVLSTF